MLTLPCRWQEPASLSARFVGRMAASRSRRPGSMVSLLHPSHFRCAMLLAMLSDGCMWVPEMWDEGIDMTDELEPW
jgi:hypothetical protein